MSTHADSEIQAGEYVLGVLEADERGQVEQRVAEDPAFAAAIRLWERRLGALHELIVPINPPETIWPEIAARLDATPQPKHRQRRDFEKAVQELSEGAGPAASLLLARRVRRWRALAILALAAALSLAGFLASETLRLPSGDQRLVALLQPEGASPAISVALDPRNRTLAVRPAAPAPEGRTYEYWLLTGEPPTASSLGRARDEATLPAEALRRLRRNELRGATIAVSLEPADAPPADKPSGPFVLRGKLAGD